MPTWEREVVNNPLWLDTSNPDLYVLKSYDSSSGKWVGNDPTTAGDIDAGLFTDVVVDTEIDGGVF